MLPRSSTSAARISVDTETEVPGGWVFRVRVAPPATGSDGAGTAELAREASGEGAASPSSLHDVRLSWPDYEYWGHGSVCPSRVVEIVVGVLLEARPDLSLPAKFDASTARRWARDLDDRVREVG